MSATDEIDRIVAAYRRTRGISFARFIVLSSFPWSVLFVGNAYLASCCERRAAMPDPAKVPW